jgi:serine protease
MSSAAGRRALRSDPRSELVMKLTRGWILLLGLAAASASALAEQPRPRASAAEATPRVIVKFRDPPASTPPARQAPGVQDRIDGLSARQALRLTLARSVSDRTHALWLERPLGGRELDRVLRRLAADPSVEYAVADRRKYRAATPNDPLFGQAPETGQWWLTAPNGTFVSAIDGPAAWALTVGDPTVVVAVLDTGAMFDHPDLGRVSEGGKLLAGYDFVGGVAGADALKVANDGDLRDADASDPGDWIDANDRRDTPFGDCELSDSSWHGVHIAGIIGALSNNGRGGAGIGWNTPILPVRVLGKCFGYDSDIVAGIRWAAGLPVPGVPANSTPARVVNLSLGALEECTAPYRNAVEELRTRNVLVVAAAGNDGVGSVASPGNCPGVVSVTALRHVGTKVGFANFGPGVTIAAPGGNCVNVGPGEPCLYPIVSADNAGLRQPGAMIYGGKLGTSFSTPMVAGVAALMLSRDPLLGNDDLVARLRLTSRVFPAPDPSLLACSDARFVPDDDDNLPNDGQCNCTPSSCGEGMLDAGKAVRAATNAVAVVDGPGAAIQGQAVSFDGSRSLPAPRRQLTSYRWSIVDGPGGGSFVAPSAPTTSFTGNAGQYTLRLTVADSVGTQDSYDFALAVSSSGGGGSGGGGGALSVLHLAFLAGALALSRRRGRG